ARQREHVAGEEPPGLVDGDRDEGRVGRRFEERPGPRGAEGTELPDARPSTLGEDDGGGAPEAHPSPELADRRQGRRGIAPIDQNVTPTTEDVGGARAPASDPPPPHAFLQHTTQAS